MPARILGSLNHKLENEEMNQWRINSWKYKVSPEGYAFPGDPLNREKAQPIAGLSELGKKLLGLEKG